MMFLAKSLEELNFGIQTHDIKKKKSCLVQNVAMQHFKNHFAEWHLAEQRREVVLPMIFALMIQMLDELECYGSTYCRF